MSTSPTRTVRIDTPINEAALRKFALAVSQALTKMQDMIDANKITAASVVNGTVASWAVSLYNEQTGIVAFLPGVRFVPVGADDVNIGFEIDVSPEAGNGVDGTSQGYMFNYGNAEGYKLAAGMSANNEDANIPRVDLGWKPTHGAAMEFYADAGDSSNTRKGQLRATIGPTGRLIVYRYVSGTTWEVVGGFGPTGELVCGYKNWGWPGDDGLGSSPPAALNVYTQATGTNPIATIDNAGLEKLKKLQLYTGTSVDSLGNTVTLDPTGAASSVTLTLQQMKLKNASDVETLCWVLCATV